MSSYISYSLFKNRKKFNPLSLFKDNENITFEEFKEFFNSRNVNSPDILYYNNVKHEFLKQKEALKINNKEVLNEDKIKIKDKKVKKTKAKRKSRKKIKDENN